MRELGTAMAASAPTIMTTIISSTNVTPRE
jgi:hypothetical protein